jgi:hypothetical protein
MLFCCIKKLGVNPGWPNDPVKTHESGLTQGWPSGQFKNYEIGQKKT